MITKHHYELIGERRTATFSDCMRYRYALDIIWDESLPMMALIGLNPSTADEMKDDPTVRRCKGFARGFGCGGLLMRNLFAYRATDPMEMKRAKNPGHCNANDESIRQASESAAFTIAAWGNHGKHLGRDAAVRILIPCLMCLRLTDAGNPEHPLYLPKDLKPIPFK